MNDKKYISKMLFGRKYLSFIIWLNCAHKILRKTFLLLRNHSKNDFRLEFRFKKRLGFQNNFFRSFWDWKNVSANNIIIFPKPLFENLTKGFRFLLKVFPFFQLSVSSLKHLRKQSVKNFFNRDKKFAKKVSNEISNLI